MRHQRGIGERIQAGQIGATVTAGQESQSQYRHKEETAGQTQSVAFPISSAVIMINR